MMEIKVVRRYRHQAGEEAWCETATAASVLPRFMSVSLGRLRPAWRRDSPNPYDANISPSCRIEFSTCSCDECDAQHAEDAHHRRMPVIGGKVTSAAASGVSTSVSR